MVDKVNYASYSLYDDAVSSEKYKFSIVGGGINVIGVMQNELSIGGHNEFGSAKDLMQAGIGALGGIGNKILAMKEYANIAVKMSGRSNVTDFESRNVWDSSSKPTFQIEYKIYNMSWKESITKRGALPMAKNLQKGILPDKGKPSPGRKGVFFKAPLGYKFTGKNGVQGTLTLKIGNWFIASNLVMTDTNFTPSIQTMRNGQPLWVTGSVTLEPYQLITYKTFMSYFPSPSK